MKADEKTVMEESDGSSSVNLALLFRCYYELVFIGCFGGNSQNSPKRLDFFDFSYYSIDRLIIFL